MILPTVAQQSLSDPKLIGFFMWTAGVAAAMVVIGVVAGMWIRRLRRSDWSQSRTTGFTLSDLRRLHREGKLTDAQFERAKQMVIAQSGLGQAPADSSDTPKHAADNHGDSRESDGAS